MKKNDLTKIDHERVLTRNEFQHLQDVPPEIEWFANLQNHHTRRAYISDVKEFMKFTGIIEPKEFRDITRSHVLAWRRQLEDRELAAATIRRKLSAISSLFEFLCENNAIERSPTHGVKRPS